MTVMEEQFAQFTAGYAQTREVEESVQQPNGEDDFVIRIGEFELTGVAAWLTFIIAALSLLKTLIEAASWVQRRSKPIRIAAWSGPMSTEAGPAILVRADISNRLKNEQGLAVLRVVGAPRWAGRRRPRWKANVASSGSRQDRPVPLPAVGPGRSVSTAILIHGAEPSDRLWVVAGFQHDRLAAARAKPGERAPQLEVIEHKPRAPTAAPDSSSAPS